MMPALAPVGPDPRIAAAAAGDREASQQLCRDLLPRVRNLVRYLLRGDSRVDDVAQEALIAVLRGLATFRGERGARDDAIRRIRAETQPGAHAPVEGAASEAAGNLYLQRRELVAALDR